MSVKRSPTKQRPGATLTGSQTDLTDYDSTASDSQITQRKRKQPESENVQKADFDGFKKEVMFLLHEIKHSNDNLIQTIRSDIAEIKTQVSSVIKTVDSLSQQQNQFKNDLAELSKSLDFHSKSFDNLQNKTQTLSKEVIELKKLERERDAYIVRLSTLERDFNMQQQRERLHNMEISGFPEQKNEDLSKSLLSICAVLGVKISKPDIISIYRVPHRLPNTKPKNIIVKLSNQLIKDTIISAVRRRKGLTTADLELRLTAENPLRIYINEHLTPFYKALHKKTREAVASAAYKYVWIRNGKIFVRRNDTSPFFNITDTKDLERIK